MQNDAFVELLRREFERKKNRNRSYSLRSYSRDLGLDPSNLSKIMSSQKLLGPRLRKKLAQRLGLSAEDLDAVEGRPTRIADADYGALSLEVFEVVSGWQHNAILELWKLKDFTPTIPQISRRLAISPDVARESLKRLERVGLLTKDARGRLRPREESSSSILTTATSSAHRRHQDEILQGAVRALHEVPIEWRSQSSMTFAIDTQKLDEARALIKTFRRQMGRLLSQSANLDEVYQMSISLYPVTQKSRKENT